ncbi:MAG TPA: MFS transporter [Sporichthya sp.]|nr:MFS transporter [Sporichthya sp.]
MTTQASDAATAPPAPARKVDELGFEERSHREILIVMSGLMVAMLLAMLDNMIIAPALPTIVGELGGLEHLAWVNTAYILGTAVSTPLWGKFGDMFSRKYVFMTAIVVFVAGSAISGAAQNMDQLIIFRLLQGLGAGGLIVGVMSVLAVLIPPRDRGRYIGYFMAIMPVSMIAGPLAGGAITDHASWRWTFYINVPLGIVALFVVWVTMHLPAQPKKKVRIDWFGAGLMVVWITGLVLITTWGGTQYDWSSPTIVGLSVLTVVFFAAFIRVQLKVAEPIMPLGPFRIPNFSLVAGVSLILGFTMFGSMTFLPQFQQYVQGASATNSGLLLLPMMIGTVSTSVTVGQFVSRTGHYKTFPILGTALAVVGLFLLATMDENTSRTETGIYMFVLGFGMGMLFQTTQLIAQNSVELKDVGSATAAVMFVRSMGGSIGISLLGAMYANKLTDSMQSRLGADNPLGDSGAQLSPQVVKSLPDNVIGALQHGIVDGIAGVMFWSGVIGLVGVACAVFIKQVPLRGINSAPKPVEPAQAAAAVEIEASAAPTVVPEAAAVPAGLTVQNAGAGLLVCAIGGVPVPGAAVTLLARNGRQIEVGRANDSGAYLPSPEGTQAYAVIASAPGYAPHAGLVVPPNGVAQQVVLTPLSAAAVAPADAQPQPASP